jgi:DNA-binding transcriptional ArsR family regulator
MPGHSCPSPGIQSTHSLKRGSVAIRFQLAVADEAALAFAASPLLECVNSLHVLAEPKHHALQHEWVRAMRKLPAALRREQTALSFLYRNTLPNCILPSPTSGDEDFETELGRLRSLRAEVAAFDFLRPLYDHGGAERSRARVLRDSDVRALALRRASGFGTASREAAALLFDDPAALIERFARLLEAYWEQAFGAEWSRIEPKLAAGIAAAGEQIARDGVYALLVQLAPALRVDPNAQTFGLDVPHEHRVVLGADNPLLLVPSVYVWPHVRVNCDGPWPLALVYRAPYLVERLLPSSTHDLERSLQALGAPTRLRILKLVAERPRSTQEVATLAALSEAAASKHLRQLASAGLVAPRREGYYVLYSVAPDKLDAVAADLRSISR